MDRCKPRLRGSGDVRAELDRAAARLDSLRRDPEFLTDGSPCSVEHARVSRQAACLRAELYGAGGRRDPIQNSSRY